MTTMSQTRDNTTTRTNTIRQEQQEQQQQSERSEHYNYYNNNTRARAELPGAEAMQMIADAYRANIGQMITRAAARIIEDALRSGMEVGTIIMAIEETGLASRPSPYYLRAVLRNWAENGVVISRVSGHVGTTEARPWWR